MAHSLENEETKKPHVSKAAYVFRTPKPAAVMVNDFLCCRKYLSGCIGDISKFFCSRPLEELIKKIGTSRRSSTPAKFLYHYLHALNKL